MARKTLVKSSQTSLRRSSGILLHPTALPASFGIGDLGPAAHRWVDWLAAAKQTWWQFLPLGPTGFGNSPYQSFSAFAGNPNLISPEALVADGLLRPDELARPTFAADHVDFGRAVPFKAALLAKAYERFQAGHAAKLQEPFQAFTEENLHWLDDFALFMSLRQVQHGVGWQEWAPSGAIADRRPWPTRDID